MSYFTNFYSRCGYLCSVVGTLCGFHSFIEQCGQQASLPENDRRSLPWGCLDKEPAGPETTPLPFSPEGGWAACKEHLNPDYLSPNHWAVTLVVYEGPPPWVSDTQISFLSHATWIGCLDLCIEKHTGLLRNHGKECPGSSGSAF